MPTPIITFTDAQNDRVALFDDGSTRINDKPTGPWLTNSQPNQNVLQYPVPAGSRTAPITYSLDANNQLGLTILNGRTNPLNGRLLVEGHKGLLYRLVNDDWEDIDTANFYIYGGITIDPAKDTLTVSDPTGAPVVVVTGMPSPDGNMHSAVTVGPGTADPGSATVPDLLTFTAQTLNKDSAGNPFTKDAEIDLNGAWDLRDGKVVFTAKLAGGSTPFSIQVGLVGELKGVAFGFQFTEAGNQANVLFTIRGKIEGQNQAGGWDFTLGYSQNRFSAELNVQSAPPKGSNGFTLNGSLKVTGGAGIPTQITLALDVAYAFNGGSLQVNVAGSGGTYSLKLSGQLKISNNWDAQFAIAYNTTTGLQSFSLALGNAQSGALNKALNVYVSGTGTKIQAGLSLNLTWVGGVIVPAA